MTDTKYLDGLARSRQLSRELAGPSLVEQWAGEIDDKAFADILAKFSSSELARLAYDWAAWARPKQRPDLSRIQHRYLLWLAGRGFGKTRSAAERVRDRVYGGARSIALMGPDYTDIERWMLGTEGEDSGLLHVFHPRDQPVYIGKPRHIVRFHTGAIGYVVSAEKPEFRGPNLDTVWADEVAKWKWLQTIWNNMLGATRKPRAGMPIEIIVTTTPRPLQFLKDLVANPRCVTICGDSTENVHNDAEWLEDMLSQFGGTRYGRQEYSGEILNDNPDALFFSSVLDASRVESAPEAMRTCIAVDPAISTEERNDETGIIGIGSDVDGHLYPFADLSGRYKPEEWGRITINAYEQSRAECIVGERNRGGDLVEANVRAAMERKRGGIAAKSIKFVNVHATKGKAIRAEPVSSLHEKGLIHFVGSLPIVESEITEWNPRAGGPSPNRLDALVWGAWYLAGLDEDQKPDYRANAVGLDKVRQQLQSPRAQQTVERSYPNRRPPRGGGDGWGNRI